MGIGASFGGWMPFHTNQFGLGKRHWKSGSGASKDFKFKDLFPIPTFCGASLLYKEKDGFGILSLTV